MIIRLGRGEAPRAPVEIQEEVELYARESGRHAKIIFVPTSFANGCIASGTWLVRFTLRPNDKRLQAYQEGQAEKPATEDVWLHESNPDEGKPISGRPGQKEGRYRPLDIVQMGTWGVRQFLESGNTWSGRGEFNSFEEQLRDVQDTNEEARVKFRADTKEENRLAQREKRRTRLKIPFLGVGVDLKKRA